jgi:DNA-binding IclR family transcriptional regulator
MESISQGQKIIGALDQGGGFCANVSSIARWTGLQIADVQTTLDGLVAQGVVQELGYTYSVDGHAERAWEAVGGKISSEARKEFDTIMHQNHWKK